MIVSCYNATKLPEGPDRMSLLVAVILVKRNIILGFIIFDEYGHRYGESADEMMVLLWDRENHFKERVVDGLEIASEAFIGLLEGKNLAN